MKQLSITNSLDTLCVQLMGIGWLGKESKEAIRISLQ